MRKKSYFKKKERQPDYLYGRPDMGRFINYLMQGGKKSTAEKVFYDALEILEKTAKEKSTDVFSRAIDNASPIQEVVSRRVGGANYQIPGDVRPERRFFLAAHWLISAARSRKGKPMAEKLAEEIMAAAKNEGTAIKKKQDMHRMAEANRAFASLLRR